MKFYNEIRNLVAHNGSQIDQSKRELILKIQKTPSIVFDLNNRVHLEKGFIKEVIEAMSKFIIKLHEKIDFGS